MEEVLFEEKGNIGIITLNRPQVLNAINHPMVLAMYSQLQQWATASAIKAVVIRAAESRGFCAGGDIRLTYERCLKKDPAATDFFRDEYHLNQLIFHYPKPYIALLDGITMGGGVGISIHGSHRVATDRLLFAMPETGIGFFPDVGGTYFLPRLKDKMGYYLGLTGARIGAADCLAIGIAQQQVARESLPQLVEALAQTTFDANARSSVTDIIQSFAVKSAPSTLMEHQQVIATCFALSTMEEILHALEQTHQEIAKETLATLNKKSPTSLKVTLRALQEGAQMDFDACMRQEYRLACHFLQEPDFLEGIRAVIIDKDQSPHWQPPSIASVTKKDVEKYFAPVTQELV